MCAQSYMYMLSVSYLDIDGRVSGSHHIHKMGSLNKGPNRKHISLNYFINIVCNTAGRYSSVGSDVAWESRGTAIDPRARHIFS